MSKKTVLITGVLGGIGSALAKGFMDAGYKVVGLDIKNATLHNCDKFFQFDLSAYIQSFEYREHWNSIFEKEIPELDVLINNAAVQFLGHLDDLRLDDWQETMAVNLTGPMLLSQFFLPALEKSKGSIINIGSIHHQLTKPNFIAYATSKSALIGLTKAMAVDLQGRVRVNAISPAAIETDMLRAGFSNDETAIDKLRNIHPVLRIGYPSDVAKLALFLSSENTGFIHGANIGLDGGISSVLKDL
jgi:NAD(P)-dependent dehydrogenase (short-subunit alcohol dehydrogenase family)